MRSDVEILTIVRDNIEERLIEGLYLLAIDLFYMNKLTKKEAGRIHNILIFNTPEGKKDSYGFYFEKGNKPLRIEYMNKLIEDYGISSDRV